ncbi:lipocalin family protein [Niabella yanshanensis]|uniref:Lipocalin family protein n=1 Tax=Niabella yanshanensis TaxID=577386 RepID=A0ABZ0WA16_9BACT|nr:lipocalin family protein [Niabella yanshanensis]WQD39991.1 lipocalin family protein [Niabella yanshanensis]
MTITKNLTVLLVAAAIFLVSCSSGKNVPIAPRKDFKGNWTITSAQLQGAEGKVNVTAFDDAALKCFEGSEWVLPNNGYGSYTINGGADCPAGARQIIWSQRVNGGTTTFNFKKMDGVKKSDSKHVQEGYSLEVTSFTENSFVAQSPIQFEGRTVYIVYTFERR